MRLSTNVRFVIGICFLAKEYAAAEVSLTLDAGNATALNMLANTADGASATITFSTVTCMYASSDCSDHLDIPTGSTPAPARFFATNLTPGGLYTITVDPFTEASGDTASTKEFCTAPLGPEAVNMSYGMQPNVFEFTYVENADDDANVRYFVFLYLDGQFVTFFGADNVTIFDVHGFQYATLYQFEFETFDGGCSEAKSETVFNFTGLSGLPAPIEGSLFVFSDNYTCTVWYYNQSMVPFDDVLTTIGEEEAAKSYVSAGQEYGILCFNATSGDEFSLKVERTLSKDGIDYARASSGSSPTLLTETVEFEWNIEKPLCSSDATCFVKTNFTKVTNLDQLFIFYETEDWSNNTNGTVSIGGESCMLDEEAEMYKCEFYTVELRGVENVFRFKICGDDYSCYSHPGDAVSEAELTVTLNTSESEATVIIESDQLNSSQIFFLLAFQCNCSDGYNQVVNNETGKVRIELRDLVPGSIVNIQALNVSDESGTVDDNFATEIEDDFCTKPLPPDFSAVIAAKNFYTFNAGIDIVGNPVQPIESSGGNLNYYVFDPDNPHGYALYSNATPLDSEMMIRGLSMGTQYNFTFYGKIDGCNGTLSTQTTALTLCSLPDQLELSAASSNATSITIKGADVSLLNGLGFTDSYIVEIIGESANISQSKAVGTEDFTITGLDPMTPYRLRAFHVYGINVQCQNGPVKGEFSEVDVCTAPEFEITEITRDESEEVPGVLRFDVSYQGTISGASITPTDHGVLWNITPVSPGRVQLVIDTTNTSKKGQQLSVTVYSNLSRDDCGITDPELLLFQSTFIVCTPPEIEITEITRDKSEEDPGVFNFNVSYQGTITGVSITPSDHGILWIIIPVSPGRVQLVIDTSNTSEEGQQLSVTVYSELSPVDCGITDPDLLRFQLTFTVCTPPEFEITEITRVSPAEDSDFLSFNVSYRGSISGALITPEDHGILTETIPFGPDQVQLRFDTTKTSKKGQQLTVTVYSNLSQVDCGITDPDLLHFQSTFTVCTPPANALIEMERLTGSGLSVGSVEAENGAFDRIDINSDPPLPDASRYLNLTADDFPLRIFSFEPGIRYQLFFDLFLGAFKETECGKGLPAYPPVRARTTKIVCSAPHPPIITVLDVSKSSFTVSLNNTRSLNRSNKWRVNVSDPDGNPNLSGFIDGFTDYVVAGLKSDTRYTVEVTLSYGLDYDCDEMGEIVSSSTAISKTKFSGMPSELSRNFLSASMCEVSWDQSDTFMASEEPSESFYEVFLNGETMLLRVIANETEYSKVIEDLDICSSYRVFIVPTKGDEVGDSAEIVLRDWERLDSATETMRDFPESIDACEVCPNADLSDICSFPFEYRGQNYSACTAKHPDDLGSNEDSWSLFCKAADGSLMECNIAAKKCLPDMPAFEESWTIKTVAVGEVSVSWNTTTDLYSAFNLYLNNKSFETSRSKSVHLRNLTIGQSYIFEVELNSYGRISPKKSVNFLPSDSLRNAFAYEPTKTSVQLAWDDLGSENITIAEILMKLDLEVSWMINASFTEEEINNLKKNMRFPPGNSRSAENLAPGLNYNVSVTGIDEANNTLENGSVRTNAPTVPNRITQQENNLTANFDVASGISVAFNVTKNTIADYFIVEVFEVTSEAVFVEVDADLMVAGYKLNTNAIDLSCEAANQSCFDRSSLGYEQRIFVTGLKSGASYIVRVSGLTASNRGETTINQHIQPPNPVRDLMVVEKLETSIQLSWQLPLGSFQGFLVEYKNHNGTSETKFRVGRSAILSGLIPGFNYTFNVYSMADLNVRSHPQTIVQGTTPAKPESVSNEQLSRNSFVISVEKPSTGLWSYLEISSVDDLSTAWLSNNEGMLRNQTIPVPINPETFSAVIHIAKSGTVVSIRVRARSASNIPGRSTRTYIITGLEPLEKKPEVMIDDHSKLCLIWDYPKKNVFYNFVKAKASTYQTISYNTQDQQDAGLTCFEKNLYDKNFTVEIEFATIDLVNNLETFSGPANFTFELQGNQFIDVHLNATCQAVSCTVDIKVDVFPNYSKFHLRYQISETNGTTFVSNDSISLNNCTVDSQLICSIEMDELQETQSYEMEVSLALFQRTAPVNASGTFITGSSASSSFAVGSDKTAVIAVSIVAGVSVLITVTIALIFTAKKFFKPTETSTFDENIAEPMFMSTYGVDSQVQIERSHFEIMSENYYSGYNAAEYDFPYDDHREYNPRNQMEYIDPDVNNQSFESTLDWNDPGYVNGWENDFDMSPYLRPPSRTEIDD